MNPLKDSDLINGIISGDQACERILLEKYDEKIRFIVYSRLSKYRSYATDLIQEIKVSVLISIRKGNFRCESELSLGAYIYGISMNKISDFVKKVTRDSEFQDNQIRFSEKSYFDKYEVEEKENKEIIRKALKNLKSKYQEVLYMKFFEELSVREISEKLKTPPRRISERINYALKLVKKELDKTKYFVQ